MPFKDPEARRAYQRERARLRRAGRADAPARAELHAVVRIGTARDVLEVLDEQLNAVRLDGSLGTIERARCIGGRAGVLLRAIETAGLEARMEALEAVLSERRGRR